MKTQSLVVKTIFFVIFVCLGHSSFASPPSASHSSTSTSNQRNSITAYERGLIYGLAPLAEMLNAENFDFHLHGLNLWDELPLKIRIRTANFYGDKLLAYLGDSKDTELRTLTHSISTFLKSYENRLQSLEKISQDQEKKRQAEDSAIRSFIEVEMKSNPRSPMLITYQDMLKQQDKEKQIDATNTLRSQKDLEQDFHEELRKIENLKRIAGRWKKQDNSDPGFMQGLTEGLQVHLLMIDNISITLGNYIHNQKVAKIRISMLRRVGNDFTRLLSILPAYDSPSHTRPIDDIKPIAIQILALTDQTLGSLRGGVHVYNSDKQLEILRQLREQLIQLNRKYSPPNVCNQLF